MSSAESRGPVLYAKADYASASRRIGAALVDLLAVILLYAALWWGGSIRQVPPDVRRMSNSAEKQRLMRKHMAPVAPYLSLVWLASCAFYHIGLRRTPGGTLGHRILGHRLVDAYGETPSWRPLVKRFFLGLPSVLFFGVAYLFCTRGPRRQAFHDAWSGTYVVRKRAVPAGPARLTYHTELLGAFLITRIDVEPDENPAEMLHDGPELAAFHEAQPPRS